MNPRVGGSHGDLAQALALAVLEHGTAGGPAGEAHVGDAHLAGELIIADLAEPSWDGSGRIDQGIHAGMSL